jgi:peptidoglycan hydrolase-like protein with peptidoglycan-binding domain
MPIDPGKCYARCLIPDATIIQTEYYLISEPGSDTEKLFELANVPISDPKQKWVKRKADKNCISADPNDCLVWCLIDIPPKMEQRKVCQDTAALYEAYIASPLEFTHSESTIEISNVRGGDTEWKEVICGDDPSYDAIVLAVQSRLDSLSYLDITAVDGFDSATKTALIKYQKDKQIVIGNLTIETLAHLKIEGFSEGGNDKGESQQNNSCVTGKIMLPDTTFVTIEFDRVIYEGNSLAKLVFFNNGTDRDIHASDYDPSNPLHSIEKNRDYNKLRKRDPDNFKTVRSSVTEIENIVEGGHKLLQCLCLDDPNYTAYAQAVEQALSSLGYEVDGKFGESTKRSLAKFQIENQRPIGFLDFGTLDLLEVQY